jgi:hypothetical protein
MKDYIHWKLFSILNGNHIAKLVFRYHFRFFSFIFSSTSVSFILRS